MEDRLKAIEDLISRARYPLDPLNAMGAKEHLASVEAGWMLKTIKELLAERI